MRSTAQAPETAPATFPGVCASYRPFHATDWTFAPRRPPSDARLAVFDSEVRLALEERRENDLEIVGSGEMTAVLGLDADWVCKRIPAWPSHASAQRCAAVIRRYVTALRAAAVDVVETDVRVVGAACDERANGEEHGASTWSVYCIQPRLDAHCFAPQRLRAAKRDEALVLYDRVVSVIARCVSPRLAPDGQLSNWAFLDERLLYLDVSSPFVRDPQGRDVLDWAHYLRSLPAPLRPVAKRWVLPRLLDKYFTLRGQIVDLLGNLKKERLECWIEPFRTHANQLLALAPPIGPEEVERYYIADARTYAFLQAARRLDRAVHRVLRREYPYVLPPKIERNT